MTKVARLFEQEKEEAVKEAVKEAQKEKALQIAKKMLEVLPASEIAEFTGLTLEEVETLTKKYLNLFKRDPAHVPNPCLY